VNIACPALLVNLVPPVLFAPVTVKFTGTPPGHGPKNNPKKHVTEAVTVCGVPTGFWSNGGASVRLVGVCALAAFA
jgi:hypothetical protein